MSTSRIASLAVLGLALLAAPAEAQKKKVPLLKLSSGTTTIAPDPGFAAALQSANVFASVLPPGEATEDGFAFPITSGKLLGNEPQAGQIRHSGGLRLIGNDGNLDLNNLRINDGKVGTVTAQIGPDGPRAAIATLDAEDATGRLTKRRFTLTGVRVVLTPDASAVLNEFFHVDTFRGGAVIGTATVDAIIRIKLRKKQG